MGNAIIREGAGVAPLNAVVAAAAMPEQPNSSDDIMYDAEKWPANPAVPVSPTRKLDPFYEEGGVQLLSVEVLQFKCSNPDTDKTLQAIIKETADRLKKKECQKGENEVALSKLEGEIEQEKLNKELIEIKKSHLKTESRIEGEAEYHKVAAFLGGLTREGADEVSIPIEQAVKMYEMLRKLDSVKALSKSNASLYVTPNDVNLTVGNLYPSAHGKQGNECPLSPAGVCQM